jgi:hypothetical protein
MTHLTFKSLCRDSSGKFVAGKIKSLERKSAQIISMQSLTDSFFSSPPSSSSSSTPFTGDISCSGTSYDEGQSVRGRGMFSKQ